MKELNVINIDTMSSKEVAELTGKMHKNIVRDIREMLQELDGSDLSHEEYQELTDNRGYTQEFLLNEELTLTLVSGYNVKMRNTIIKRWKELEHSGVSTDVRDHVMLPAYKVEADLYIQQVRKKHAKAMEQITLESEIIHNKLTELRMVKVNGDVNASRAQLPRESITKLLLDAGSTITPKEANNVLIKLGFLHKNRKTITQGGLYYGHSWTGGKTHNPKWYSIDFKTDLLIKIKEELNV